jgi:hypothetical protein
MPSHLNRAAGGLRSSIFHLTFSSPRFRSPWASILFLAVALAAAKAAEPPVIPIGLDAYRQWDRWPYQRIGARAYMRSTYDRRGGNEGADASHFLYQLADTNNVTLDVEEPGVLYFARYNHWHGSPWHYVVDGADHLVQETSTADPTILPMNRQNSARSWSAAAPCRFRAWLTFQSGRGLSHSKTLTRHRMFMGAMRANIRGSLIMARVRGRQVVSTPRLWGSLGVALG